MERLVRFNLLGQEYSFYTGAPAGEVEKILDLVRGVAEETAPSVTGSIVTAKIAVLTSLNIASRYVELQKDLEDYTDKMEKRIMNLNEQIKEHISSEKG